MGLFNNKKHEQNEQEAMMNNNGMAPNDGYAAPHNGAHMGHNQHQHQAADSSFPSQLQMPNVPTVPPHAPAHVAQPIIAEQALHQRHDPNDRYAGAMNAPAAAYGSQMTSNHAGPMHTNNVGNMHNQQALNDPSRNYQAPLQETQPFQESGIGGQTLGQTHHNQHHQHHGHDGVNRREEAALGGAQTYGQTHPNSHHQQHGAGGVGYSEGQNLTSNQTDDVRHHPGHRIPEGGRRTDETTGPRTSHEADAEFKEAKKEAQSGKIQKIAGKILSSETMQAKGQAKLDHADALKAESHHLNAAERLEEEARARRQMAAQGGNIHNTNQAGGQYDQRRGNIA